MSITLLLVPIVTVILKKNYIKVLITIIYNIRELAYVGGDST